MQKKINQILFVNNKIIYLLLFVLFLVIVLSQFSIKNDNKFVNASEKAIASVVTIYTSSNINTPRNLFQRKIFGVHQVLIIQRKNLLGKFIID